MNENIAGSTRDVKHLIRIDSDIRLVCYLESIFVFSLTWSVGNILKNEYRTAFNQFIKTSLDQYIEFRFQQTRVRFQKENYPFAMNLRQILESGSSKQASIFEYCFDVGRSEWIGWGEVSLEEFGVISGNLASNAIDNKELIRLNPYAIDIIENKISKEPHTLSLPYKPLFVETNATKITKHFLQYFVAYQKPLLLIARSQNGLTTLVHQRTQVLIEQFHYSPIFLSCTAHLSLRRFQKSIESNMVSQQPSTLTSPNRTHSIVIVDDINLAMQ